jgi:hypothetical protein
MRAREIRNKKRYALNAEEHRKEDVEDSVIDIT